MKSINLCIGLLGEITLKMIFHHENEFQLWSGP